MFRLPLSRRSVWQALAFSSAVVVLLIAAEGLLMLPIILDTPLPMIAVRHCVLRGTDAPALSVLRVFCQSEASPIKYVLARHELSANPQARVVLAGIDPISAFDCATDELVVISGGAEFGSIYTLNLLETPPKPRLLGRQTDGDPISVVISPDRRWLASHACQAVYLWDLHERRLKWRRDVEAGCVAFAPRLDRLVCGLIDGRVVEMSLQDGQIRATIAIHRAPVKCLAIDPHGERLASAGEYERLIVSDFHRRRPLWSTSGTSAHTMQFSPSGEVLFTSPVELPLGRGDSRVELRNARTGGLIGKLGRDEERTHGGVFLNDHTVCTWGGDGAIRIWDAREQTLLKVVRPTLTMTAIDELWPDYQ